MGNDVGGDNSSMAGCLGSLLLLFEIDHVASSKDVFVTGQLEGGPNLHKAFTGENVRG